MSYLVRLYQFFFSFTGRMLFVMLLIHAVLLPTLFGGLYYLVKQDYQVQFVDYARNDAQRFATNLSQTWSHRTRAQIGDELDDAMLMTLLVSVDIVENGEPIISRSLVEGRVTESFREDFLFGQGNDDVYHIALPLFTGEGDTDVILRLVYDEYSTRERIETAYRYALYLGGSYIILTLLIFGLFTPYLTRPLKQLSRASHKIAAGCHDAQFIPRSRLPEVVSLATDLEHMRRKLLEQQQELVANEKVLRRSHEELELKVLERTTDLRITNEELLLARDAALESVRLKSEFLATMSHEIRTPMNGIMGMLDLLHETELSAEQTEYAEVALSSAKTLLVILNDILDFSKIEANQIVFEWSDCEVRDSIEQIVALMKYSVQEKGLELRIDIAADVPVMFCCDSIRVRQVLTNLIVNAIKFTHQGSVTVSVVHEQYKGGPALRFAVIDTGIGVKPEAQVQIFDAFVQEDGSTTREYGGTGLGLAICKQLITCMGGEIGIDSVPGCGSTFYFSLPLVACETKQ